MGLACVASVNSLHAGHLSPHSSSAVLNEDATSFLEVSAGTGMKTIPRELCDSSLAATLKNSLWSANNNAKPPYYGKIDGNNNAWLSNAWSNCKNFLFEFFFPHY